MRAIEIMLVESELDELGSDIADLVFAKHGQNVQSMSFDDFLREVRARGHKEVSSALLRDILEDLPIIQSVDIDTIEFMGNVPKDMDQDSIEDMGARVGSMADQEALKGIKAEL